MLLFWLTPPRVLQVKCGQYWGTLPACGGGVGAGLWRPLNLEVLGFGPLGLYINLTPLGTIAPQSNLLKL